MNVIQNIFNSRFSKNGNFFTPLQKILGFTPKTLSYYQRAFTHSSLNKKDEFGNGLSYERLEFLGDAILSAVVAAYLFDEFPTANEGYLTKMRSKIVSRQHLNKLGEDFKLVQFMETEFSSERFGENIHGNLFEALIGAVYMDKGFKCCEKFINHRVIQNYVNIHELEGKVISYKSLLIEWCQKEKKPFEFEVYEDTGKETTTHFSVKLWIAGEVVAKARSTAKKKAEEKASKRAYYAFQNKIDTC